MSTDSGKWDLRHIPNWQLECFLGEIPDRDLERIFGKLASQPTSRYLEPVFVELLNRCQDDLVDYIARLVRNAYDVEDLTQEAVTRAFQHRARYNPEHLFRNWIFTIARNAVFNHFRSGKRRAARFEQLKDENVAATVSDQQRSVEETVIAREEWDQLVGQCTRDRDRRLLDAWKRNQFDGDPWPEITVDMSWEMSPESLRVACARLVNTLRRNRPKP